MSHRKTNFIIAFSTLLWSGLAAAQPAGTSAGPVVHLRVSGDLEAAKDAAAIKSALGESCKQHSPLIVLELSGNRARLDLVRDVGDAIRKSPTPIAVFLADPQDKLVGPGQLCLALLAGSCAVEPTTAVRGIPGETPLASLAPEDTAWSAITAELYEWMQRAHPTLPEGLAPGLVSPTRALWMKIDAGKPVLVTERAGAEASPVITDVRGTPQVSLDSKTIARLGLCEPAPHWSALVTKAGVATAARTERTLEIGLAQPASRVPPILSRIDYDLDALKPILKLAWPRPKKVAADTYRAAAAKARPKLDDANAAMTQLEQILLDYPELLRRPAPDQTEIGAKPSTYTARWRSLVQTRKDHLARDSAIADKFAAVKD